MTLNDPEDHFGYYMYIVMPDPMGRGGIMFSTCTAVCACVRAAPGWRHSAAGLLSTSNS